MVKRFPILRNIIIAVAVALFALLQREVTAAFIQKHQIITNAPLTKYPAPFTSTKMQNSPTAIFSLLTGHVDVGIIESIHSSSSTLMISDISETVTTVLAGLGGIAVILVGIVYILAAFVIPTASKQVEALAKQLDPELWKEYEQKMGPGETLAMRPDLMEELGNKVLELQNKRFDSAAAAAAAAIRERRSDVVSEERSTSSDTNSDEPVTPDIVVTKSGTTSSATTTTSTNNNSNQQSSIDVEIISKSKWDD